MFRVTRPVIISQPFRERKLPDAIYWYSNAIDIEPKNSNALINRGVLYAEASKEERALDDFTAAIKAAPDEFKTYINLGAA